MARIWLSIYRMCCGRCIRGVSEGACSISGQGLKDLEGRKDSWCTTPGVAQETSNVTLSSFTVFESLTLGEKFMSLIIRFLLHRSS